MFSSLAERGIDIGDIAALRLLESHGLIAENRAYVGVEGRGRIGWKSLLGFILQDIQKSN